MPKAIIQSYKDIIDEEFNSNIGIRTTLYIIVPLSSKRPHDNHKKIKK